jgi:hypothetical protein
MCRELLGAEMADRLGVPKTSWRFLVPFVRRVVSSMELLRERVPFAGVPAAWAGRRYWDRVVEGGLAQTTAESVTENRSRSKLFGGGAPKNHETVTSRSRRRWRERRELGAG